MPFSEQQVREVSYIRPFWYSCSITLPQACLTQVTSSSSMLTSSVASHLHPESFYTGPLEPWVRDIQRSSDARNCHIERIVHRKCTTGMEHEFLILYAQDAAGQGVVLSVDRNASEEARFTLRASLPPKKRSLVTFGLTITRSSTCVRSGRGLSRRHCRLHLSPPRRDPLS